MVLGLTLVISSERLGSENAFSVCKLSWTFGCRKGLMVIRIHEVVSWLIEIICA